MDVSVTNYWFEEPRIEMGKWRVSWGSIEASDSLWSRDYKEDGGEGQVYVLKEPSQLPGSSWFPDCHARAFKRSPAPRCCSEVSREIIILRARQEITTKKGCEIDSSPWENTSIRKPGSTDSGHSDQPQTHSRWCLEQNEKVGIPFPLLPSGIYISSC